MCFQTHVFVVCFCCLRTVFHASIFCSNNFGFSRAPKLAPKTHTHGTIENRVKATCFSRAPKQAPKTQFWGTIETRAKTSLICVSRHFETSLENKPICLNKRRVDSIRGIAAKVFRLVLRHRRLFHAALPHIACVAALPHIMGGHACELCFSHSRTMRLMRSICDDQELVFFNPVERRWLDKTSLGLADKNHNI